MREQRLLPLVMVVTVLAVSGCLREVVGPDWSLFGHCDGRNADGAPSASALSSRLSGRDGSDAPAVPPPAASVRGCSSGGAGWSGGNEPEMQRR